MSEKLKETTSKRIKELRLSHNFTMEILAEKIGVSKSTIAKWENGYVENMRQDNILKLSKIFNVPATFIMGYDEQSYKTETEQEHQFVALYNKLNSDQKDIIDNLIVTFLSNQ